MNQQSETHREAIEAARQFELQEEREQLREGVILFKAPSDREKEMAAIIKEAEAPFKKSAYMKPDPILVISALAHMVWLARDEIRGLREMLVKDQEKP
jgi:hypothetical protein